MNWCFFLRSKKHFIIFNSPLLLQGGRIKWAGESPAKHVNNLFDVAETSLLRSAGSFCQSFADLLKQRRNKAMTRYTQILACTGFFLGTFQAEGKCLEMSFIQGLSSQKSSVAVDFRKRQCTTSFHALYIYFKSTLECCTGSSLGALFKANLRGQISKYLVIHILHFTQAGSCKSNNFQRRKRCDGRVKVLGKVRDSRKYYFALKGFKPQKVSPFFGRYQ